MAAVKVDGTEVRYDRLPEVYRETVRAYVEYGIRPGFGWQLILSNDLRAVVAVDEGTLEMLPALYRWLVNYAPSKCWGSPEKMTAWRAKREPSHE